MVPSTATSGQSIGSICKAETSHSEQLGNPTTGIEVPTANQDWYEIKKAAFASTACTSSRPMLSGITASSRT